MVFRAGQLAQVSLDKIERNEWRDPDGKDMKTRTGLLGQDSRAGRDRQDRTAGTAELEKEFWDRLVGKRQLERKTVAGKRLQDGQNMTTWAG
jgi:hypothetical protein